MQEVEIGDIKHFYKKISVAVIKLSQDMKVGENLHIKGATTDFEQGIDSMQIEHEKVKEAKSGDSVGVKLKNPAREGDIVFRVEE